jgi:hypothetical protein
MTDSALFYEVLANVAYIGPGILQFHNDNVDSLRYHGMAISSVNRRLEDPILSVSDGTIGTVLAFAVFSAS